MITLVYRGSGLFVPFYIGICMWIVGIWFPKRTFHDVSFTAWVFLAAAVITALHALRLLLQQRRFAGDATARQSPENIWSHSFFFLPVIAWSVIFAGISAWNFFAR